MFVFADDIFLLSASRLGLQSMVNICAKFASGRNLAFGTNPIPAKSKTKCIIFSKRTNDTKNVKNITLNGVPLPWVEKVLHLGNMLESDNSMKSDIALKRGKFIGKINSILQEFHFANEDMIIKLLNIYTTSFYGSSMWDPLSSCCDKIYKSWNVAMRNIMNVDRTTHRYMIEPLSQSLHPKVMLISRMIGFYKTNVNSSKFCVRFLVKLAEKDLRTALGRTLHYAAVNCGISDGDYSRLSPGTVKKKLKYATATEENLWKVLLACELKSLRDDDLTLNDFHDYEIEELLRYVCTS